MITYYICGQLTDPAKTHRYYAGSPLLVQSILSVEIMNFAFAPNHCVGSFFLSMLDYQVCLNLVL